MQTFRLPHRGLSGAIVLRQDVCVDAKGTDTRTVAAGREPSGVAAETAEIFCRSRPDGSRRSADVNPIWLAP